MPTKGGAPFIVRRSSFEMRDAFYVWSKSGTYPRGAPFGGLTSKCLTNQKVSSHDKHASLLLHGFGYNHEKNCGPIL